MLVTWSELQRPEGQQWVTSVRRGTYSFFSSAAVVPALQKLIGEFLPKAWRTWPGHGHVNPYLSPYPWPLRLSRPIHQWVHHQCWVNQHWITAERAVAMSPDKIQCENLPLEVSNNIYDTVFLWIVWLNANLESIKLMQRRCWFAQWYYQLSWKTSKLLCMLL